MAKEPTLYARMELSLTEAEKRLAKFNAGLDKTMGSMERRTARSAAVIEKTLAKSFDTRGIERSLQGFGASIVAAFSIDKFEDLIDASIRIKNALKVAGLSGSELDRVMSSLFASAQKNSTPLEALATLYGRVSTVQKELGVSSEDLLKFTDNVALALRVAGTDATTASGALLQLSQALGGGVVHAEEFNSLLEGTLPIVQAAAIGIKEAGGSVSKLRQLVNDGKVSSEAFFRGFEAGAASLQVRAANSAETVAQAITKLNNALTIAAGRFNDVTGASQTAASYIKGLGDYVDALSRVFDAAANNSSIGTFIQKLQQIAGLLQSVQGLLPASLNPLGALPSTEELNNISGLLKDKPADRSDLQKQLESLRSAVKNDPNANTELYQQQINDIMGQLYGDHDTRLKLDPAKIATNGISLSDYPANPGKTPGARKSGATKMDDYDRAVQSTTEETAALNAKYAALSKLNPLSADYAEKVTAVEKAQELLTAAQKSGKPAGKELADVQQLLFGDISSLTPEAQKQALVMRDLAFGYANAEANGKKLSELQDTIKQQLQDSAELGKDVAHTLVDGLRNSASAAEILTSVLDKVISKIIDMQINMLFDGSVANSGGGILGSLFKPLLTAFSPTPVTGGTPAAANVANAVRPASAQASSAQHVHVTVGVASDGNGNIRPFVESVAHRVSARNVSAGIKHYDSKVAPQTAIKAVQTYQQRGG